MIQDGRYTLVYNGGEYRTVQIEKVAEGDLKDKVILSLKSGQRYSGIAFLSNDNRVMFWRKFSSTNSQERMNAIQNAVNRIAKNPKDAGMAYAMQEGRCCRCGRELTVPASIHAGMGPDCAQKYAWVTADQIEVHKDLVATRVPDSNFAAVESTPNQVLTAALSRTPAQQNAQLMNVLDPKHSVARMVQFHRSTDSKGFYDPFGIDEQLSEAAAAAFWTKRFTATPLDDDRFWGDEAGRAEQAQEDAIYMAEIQ